MLKSLINCSKGGQNGAKISSSVLIDFSKQDSIPIAYRDLDVSRRAISSKFSR